MDPFGKQTSWASKIWSGSLIRMNIIWSIWNIRYRNKCFVKIWNIVPCQFLNLRSLWVSLISQTHETRSLTQNDDMSKSRLVWSSDLMDMCLCVCIVLRNFVMKKIGYKIECTSVICGPNRKLFTHMRRVR